MHALIAGVHKVLRHPLSGFHWEEMTGQAWLDGSYRTENMFADLVEVRGNTATFLGMEARLLAGQFGPADPAVQAETGQLEATVSMEFSYGAEIRDLGVVTDEGESHSAPARLKKVFIQ